MKILVIGGTGGQGRYLVPELLTKGYTVDVISLDEKTSDNPKLKFIQADAFNIDFLKEILKNNYDAIVDFLDYATEKFKARYELFLKNTKHYIFLSSYRVYADDVTITEESPRLLDVSEDKEFLATDAYPLHKARCEDILRNSGYKNWSIVRPVMLYSEFMYKLVTLDSPLFIPRTLRGEKIVLPKEAMPIYAAFCWAGDVAKMYSGIILNPKAYGEAFTFGSGETATWEEVAKYYSEFIGVKYELVDKETYLKVMFDNANFARWQLEYDRLLNRKIDNSKILEIAGLKQSDLMPLKEGLEKVLAVVDENTTWGPEWKPSVETADRGLREYFKRKGEKI